ncbi:MAG TPA: hypothetical protein VMD91_04245 [Candidatus Sulfotelmatobacter sp.]|nr:hypothetical protein [Candidatus Sulfotelmatobacter sp.]
MPFTESVKKPHHGVRPVPVFPVIVGTIGFCALIGVAVGAGVGVIVGFPTQFGETTPDPLSCGHVMSGLARLVV